MIKVGDAFKCRKEPYHVYIVITPPDENGEAFIVNLSSLDPGEEDLTVVLESTDYPEYITRPTVVRFRWTNKGPFPVASLENNTLWDRMPAITKATLGRIQQGALETDFVRPNYKKVIAEIIGLMD